MSRDGGQTVTLSAKQQRAVSAIHALAEYQHIQDKVVTDMRVNIVDRFPTERWLDENEREWNALSDLFRSRKWAANQHERCPYPFRDATNDMRKAEGMFLGDDKYPPKPSARESWHSGMLTHLHGVEQFPPSQRVILFAPEFASEGWYDKSAWSALSLRDPTDVWVLSWQGWREFDEMLQEVTDAMLSFGDGATTLWLGHSMGAIVAYEVLKILESHHMSNYPVALVVSGCPSPCNLSKDFAADERYGWLWKLNSVKDFAGLGQEQIDLMRRDFRVTLKRNASGLVAHPPERSMLMDLSFMRTYSPRNTENDAKLHIPIIAICHGEDELVGPDALEAWAQFTDCNSKSVCGFELINLDNLGDEEVLAEVGHGFVAEPTPVFVDKVSEALLQHQIEKDIEKLSANFDIGPTDGSLPQEVDRIVVGAGIGGVCTADVFAESGSSVLVLEQAEKIGGVWQSYANVYSRVNTSEVGYRIITQNGPAARCNEDHSPTHDIMRDIHAVASKHCRGCFRTQMHVNKVEKRQDKTFDVTVQNLRDSTTHVVHAKSVNLHVNRRIGQRREVEYGHEHLFRGDIRYGFANEVLGLNFWGKRVIIVGSGAFALESLRTALEKGAKHVTILARRAGTASPKWIDMIAYLRPTIDKYYNLNKTGNLISFDVWKRCYTDNGLPTPACWKEGLLKPHNQTISVSDAVFIGGYHGMVSLKTGEIKRFSPDGFGVTLTDRSDLKADIVIKCTGFHLTSEASQLTGHSKTYPWGSLDFNLVYYSEPLFDGGMFGGSKGRVELEETSTPSESEVAQGHAVSQRLGLETDAFVPRNNPFGSGAVGGILQFAHFSQYLYEHPDEQRNLLECAGNPPNDARDLWISTMADGFRVIGARIFAALGDA